MVAARPRAGRSWPLAEAPSMAEAAEAEADAEAGPAEGGGTRLTRGEGRAGGSVGEEEGSARLGAVAYRRRAESVELLERWRGVADNEGEDDDDAAAWSSPPEPDGPSGRGAGELTRDDEPRGYWADDGGGGRGKEADAEEDKGPAAGAGGNDRVRRDSEGEVVLGKVASV